MTGLFDGVAGLLAGTFGSTVTHTPAGGSAASVQGIFRSIPVEAAEDDGRIALVVASSLQVLATDAAGIAYGDTIAPGDGATYTVRGRMPSGSPAADAFVLFQLEKNP